MNSLSAMILSAYLKDKEADIILAGNVTVDGSSGQVGPRLAEVLGISAVTTITKLVVEGNKAIIERDVEGDIEMVETQLPLLVTCQQGLNEPRYPSLPGIMKAKKKPLEKLDLDDLDFDEDEVEAKTKTVERFLPARKGEGKILEGEIAQQVKELASLLSNRSKSYLINDHAKSNEIRGGNHMSKKVLVLGEVRQGELVKFHLKRLLQPSKLRMVEK